ncbi:hypothetical protein ThrDRAFT_04480 [Frankia casuarinae]|uniref:Uncharacterized protein n=2 Tax=Frankia TaxID=1854 RepID=Q2J6B9_FRACC|nr:hypothetical protein Francci3_3823 [Frankia casuarinae]ETA00575.1 hypothetical protein CcI6DRAFT_04034 [Frankia sp. CcI6]KDA41535.1 hypothetical protein BMG523Draft_03668 [Frankia sp. BMG5.23]OHV51032.1 phosphotransacetylase [Frankia sp. CgIS1]ORT49094.1 phosphotransacetylase [Frankia sp. KB5]
MFGDISTYARRRPVTIAAACPRCLGPLRPPDLWSSQWRCDDHGEVSPYRTAVSSREQALHALSKTSTVPIWLPQPMPVHWYVSGVGWAGDERTGPRATAVAAAGPSPLGGPAEMVLVAEAPRVGLGARLAGISGPDPEPLPGVPEAKVEAAGHPTALWPLVVPPDRAAFVGEARGVWLWLVLWPADAALLLLEHLVLRDLRDDPQLGERSFFGASSQHLSAGPLPGR